MSSAFVTAEEGWNSIYSGENLKFISKEVPSENLVRWYKRFVERDLAGAKEVSVLDVGFGTGSDLEYFAGKDWNVCGLEVSDNALRHTSRKLKERIGEGCSYQLMKYSEKFPFRDNSFDLVYSMEVLHYSGTEAAARNAVEEIHRVMRPGKHCIVSIAGIRNLFAGRSDRIRENEYVFNDSYPERKGMRLFIPETSIVLERVFSLFREPDIGYYEYSAGKNETAFFWLVHGRKEK